MEYGSRGSRPTHPIFTHGIIVDELIKQWRVDRHETISRLKFIEYIGNNDIFFINTREKIIEIVLDGRLLTNSPLERVYKLQVILFLIFGDYGIQPAIRAYG